MHRFILRRFFYILLILVFFILVPNSAYAAELFFKLVPKKDTGNEPTIIEVRIDPLTKTLNAVEGAISIQGIGTDQLTVQTENGGSVLTLWPTPLLYFDSEQVVRFVGGVPGGFNQPGLLFRLRLTSTSAGQATLTWIGGAAYLNDGQGTAEGITSRPMTINLEAQSPEEMSVSSPDQLPPVFDMLEIGQDPSVYEGKYFVSFHATDDISGVSRYEVKEGDQVTEVTDGVYIFKDQSRQTPLVITAYDQAGNRQIKKITLGFNWLKYVIIIAVIIIGAIIIYGVKKFIKK